MVNEKRYIRKNKRITHFEVGSIVLAMVKCENKRESSKASNIARIMFDDYNNIDINHNIDINRISKILESINNGIYIEQDEEDDKLFDIINYDERFKSYSIDYSQLFNLFLETLIEYPVADKPIEKEAFLNDIKKEKDRFIRFIKKFANNFNFKQEWALFELGETIGYACALYLHKSNTNSKSPWYKLGEFIRNPDKSRSISESVKELK